MPILERDETYFAGYAFMTLKWTLGSAVLDLDQLPFGRVFGTANWTYLELKYQVQRLYEERRRLLLKLLTTPPANPRAYMFMKLRLEELTIQLNVYTGGDWEEPVAWIESLP